MRLMRIRLLAALVAFAAISACKRSPPPPTRTTAATVAAPLPTTAPAAHFDKDKLVVDGHPEWKCDVRYTVDGDLTCASVGSWPAKTKLVLGKDDAWIEANGVTTIKRPYAIYGGIPIAEEKPDAGPLAGLGAPDPMFEPSSSITFRFDNGVEMVVPLPKQKVLKSLADKVMGYAQTTALTFDGEGEHKGPHTAYYVHPTQSSAVLGPGTKLVDADWIASATSKVEKMEGKTCSFNTGSVYPLEIETQTVKILDRKTNAVVEEKTFAPKTIGCPTFAFGGHATIGPGRDVVFAWVKSVAKAHGG